MDVLQTLSVALGLAALAGINLYLTVFVTGLAVHFGWVTLPQHLEALNVLGHPWIIGIAGTLYVLEFFADKVPWIDSLNDGIHTLIRPLGGALIAVLALGEASPVMKVIAALLAGGVALTAHATKASTRLVANASPEPVSNIGLSLGGDALVLGGLGLIAWNPLVALVVALVTLAVIWTFLPRILRSVRVTTWFAWRKLNTPSAGSEVSTLPLPAFFEHALRQSHSTEEPVVLSVPCVSGSGPRLPKNRFGWLARFRDGRTFFVGRRWRGPFVTEIPAREAATERESRFLCEKLTVRSDLGGTFVLLFERGHRLLADRAASDLKNVPASAPVEVKEPAVAA
jgi:hypothetical protein